MFYPGTVRVNSLIQLAVAVCSLGQSPVRCDESCCSLSATLHQCQSQERVCPKTELPKTYSNPKLTYSKPTWATCQRALAQVFLDHFEHGGTARAIVWAWKWGISRIKASHFLPQRTTNSKPHTKSPNGLRWQFCHIVLCQYGSQSFPAIAA